MIDELSQTNILLSSPYSWPEPILSFFIKNSSSISKYYEEMNRIDKLAEKKVYLRIKRPPNKHQTEFDHLQYQLDKIINDFKVISFHCTRLTKEEQEDLLKNGLNPLSPNLIIKQIEQIRKQNLISDEIYEQIKNNNNSNDDNRKGMVWFFHFEQELNHPNGVYELLGKWGGESVYRNFDDNEAVLLKIQKIGEPCIVISLLPAKEVVTFGSVVERMLQIWNNRDDLWIGYDADTSISHIVEVKHIIRYSDPLFEQLTRVSKWGVEFI